MREIRGVAVPLVLALLVAFPASAGAVDGEPGSGEQPVLGAVEMQHAICFPDVCFLLDFELPGLATPVEVVDPAVPEPFPEATQLIPETPIDDDPETRIDGDPDRPIVETPPEFVGIELADMLAQIVDGEELPDLDALGLDLLSGAELQVIDAGAEFDRPLMRAGADADLSGTWKVTNRKATMFCSPAGGGRKVKQPLRKTVDTVKIARNEAGILVGEGLAEERVEMTRLAPGVYGMRYRSKRRGQTVETRSFLGVDSEDAFSGTTFVSVRGKGTECSMTRGFKGKRTR